MDDEDVEIDIEVMMGYLTAVKYHQEDWQNLVQKVAQGSGIDIEKTGLILETLHDYLLELTQAN